MKKNSSDRLLKKIIKTSGVILFGNIGVAGLNFLSFAIIAKQLGPEALAILVLAQTYSLIVNDVFNIQTWESMVKFGSTNKKDTQLNNVIKTNFTLDSFSAFIACAFAISLAFPIGKMMGWDEDTTIIISIYSISILFNITTFTIGIPRLFNKFSVVAKIQVLMAFTKLLLIIAVILFKKELDNYSMLYLYTDIEELEYYILIYLLADVLANISLIFFSIYTLYSQDIKWWKEKIKLDKQQLQFIWWTNLRTIARIPVRRFDFIIISMIMPLKMVGIYKVYKEIAGILNRLSEPVNQAIFPEFAKLIGSDDTANSINIAKKMMLLLLSVSVLLTGSLLFFAKPLVTIFFGVEYLSHLNALYILIILYGISFCTVPINSLFIAAGFAKYSFYLVMFTNSLYLGVAFYAVQLIGIYGIIVAFATQLIFNQGLKVILMKRHSSDWNSTIR